MNDLLVRLRNLASMGLSIAAEAADAIEQRELAVEPMRAALAWYAEPGNWRREVRNVGPRRNWTNCRAAFDKGGRARMVLMEIGR